MAMKIKIIVTEDDSVVVASATSVDEAIAELGRLERYFEKAISA